MICPICEHEFDDDEGCLPEIDWDRVKEDAGGDPNEFNTKAAQALLKRRDEDIKRIPLWLEMFYPSPAGKTMVLRRRMPFEVFNNV